MREEVGDWICAERSGGLHGEECGYQQLTTQRCIVLKLKIHSRTLDLGNNGS